MPVEWIQEALDRLADVYVTLPLDQQRALELVVRDINARLAVEPLSLGESRETAYRRAWFAYPLLIQFDAQTDPARVVLFHCAGLRPRSTNDE